MSEALQVCARRPGSVNIDQLRAPVGEHVGLAMRRLYDNYIEFLRILSVSVKPRSVKQADWPCTDHKGMVIRLEDSGISRIPVPAEGLATKNAV